MQTALDVILQLATAWRGTDRAQLGFAWKITLACKSYTHASLPATMTVDADSSETFICVALLPFQTSCSWWWQSQQAAGLQQQSGGQRAKANKPAHIHTQQTACRGLRQRPAHSWCADNSLLYSAALHGARVQMMGGWAAWLHGGVSAGEFRKISVSWGLYQGAGQLEKVLDQIYSNQNSCAPEDVKSSYNHLWNQRLTSFLSGKLLSPDAGGKQGTEPD